MGTSNGVGLLAQCNIEAVRDNVGRQLLWREFYKNMISFINSSWSSNIITVMLFREQDLEQSGKSLR